MNALRLAAALVAAAALLLSTAASASAPEEARRPGMDFPLDGVSSVCDQFGNRVYRFGNPNAKYGSVYVLKDDCP